VGEAQRDPGLDLEPGCAPGLVQQADPERQRFTTTRTINGRTVPVYSTPAGQLMERLEQDFPDEMTKLKAAAVKRDPTIQGNAEKTKQKAIEQIFDLVGRAQFNRQTGIRVEMADWGYGQDKGLNNGLGRLRTELFKSQAGIGAMPNASGRIELGNAQAQTVLSRTWNKLRSRASGRRMTAPGRTARRTASGSSATASSRRSARAGSPSATRCSSPRTPSSSAATSAPWVCGRSSACARPPRSRSTPGPTTRVWPDGRLDEDAPRAPHREAAVHAHPGHR